MKDGMIILIFMKVSTDMKYIQMLCDSLSRILGDY